MTTSQKKLLWDIADAIDSIIAFVSGLDERAYCADALVQSAVERKFEVMGEAARRLRDESPETFDHFSSLRDVIAFRNFLIHVYDAIDQRKVWTIIVDDLPPLRERINVVLTD